MRLKKQNMNNQSFRLSSMIATKVVSLIMIILTISLITFLNESEAKYVNHILKASKICRVRSKLLDLYRVRGYSALDIVT